jgi:ABC-type branched-subunit amino acid transport system ATPase component
MAWLAERAGAAGARGAGLNVYYGASHALQGVNLRLDAGVLSVVGRNGMGKTTLCKAILGLVPAASGSIAFAGQPLIGRSPAEIARMGIGYVPQGRRLWRSLTVDEHLRMVERKGGVWSIERIYSTFPRLAERKGNGGAQLSGGEQQMLAIARALLANPRLLVMDEPTEGLAPVIVAQVEEMLHRLAEEGEIDVLVIEQNIGVACAVADRVAIMVNGQINRIVPALELAADRALQQRLLGVGRHATTRRRPPRRRPRRRGRGPARGPQAVKIYMSNPKLPTRWSQPVPVAQLERMARVVTTGAPRASAVQAEIRPLARRASRCPGRRHARHQGRGAALHARPDPRGGPAGADGGPVDERQAFGRGDPGAPVAAFHPRGAAGRLHRRPGPVGRGHDEAFRAGWRGRRGWRACCRLAARAAPRWWRRRCARCRWGCRS